MAKKIDPAMLAAMMAFQAPVTKVPAGQSSDLTEKDWAKIVRTPGKFNAKTRDHDAEFEAERIGIRRMEVAREAAFVGDHGFAAEVAGGFWDGSL
jgi:hypothetical protein